MPTIELTSSDDYKVFFGNTEADAVDITDTTGWEFISGSFNYEPINQRITTDGDNEQWRPTRYFKCSFRNISVRMTDEAMAYCGHPSGYRYMAYEEPTGGQRFAFQTSFEPTFSGDVNNYTIGWNADSDGDITPTSV